MHRKEVAMPPISRRTFLTTAATAAGSVALGCSDHPMIAPTRAQRIGGLLPDPASCGIEHVVVFMMENRSFDHLLGWLPGADGRQAGLTYADGSGVPHATFPLAPDFQGCSYNDPDHSYTGGRVEYNDGACDGWLRANDVFSIGYYRQQDLAFLGRAVPDWTSFDQYFCAILGPTFPNRIYQHAGQTDRIENTFAISQLPTVWDRLAARGLAGRYYYSDLPFLGLWGGKYLPISRLRRREFLTGANRYRRGRPPALRHPRRRGDDEPYLCGGDPEPRVGEHGPRNQLRRMGRILRPRRPTGGADSRGRSGRGKRRWPTRLPHAHPAHLTVRAPDAYVARLVRPHVGAADDRVALGPGPPHGARRDGQQSGR